MTCGDQLGRSFHIDAQDRPKRSTRQLYGRAIRRFSWRECARTAFQAGGEEEGGKNGSIPVFMFAGNVA
jgi:hypothetical protein